MRLLHSYVAARNRKTGEVEILAQAWNSSPDYDLAEVAQCHEALRESPEAHAEFSHGLFVVENQERASYEFTDPAEVKAADEAAAQLLLLADIRAAEEEAASADADAARSAAANAKLARLKAVLNPSESEANTAEGDEGEKSPASGGNAGDNPFAALEEMLLASRAKDATSLLEHVSTLPTGAPLTLTPPEHPPRLADGVDLSKPDPDSRQNAETPPVAASASTPEAESQPPQPSVEASPEGSEPPAQGEGQAPADDAAQGSADPNAETPGSSPTAEPLDLLSAVKGGSKTAKPPKR